MEGSPSWAKSLFIMRHFNLSSMITSSLETYQQVVGEIAKEIVKTRKLSDKEFITIDDLVTKEFSEAFYVDLNELQRAENMLNEFLVEAKELTEEQVRGAIADNGTFFCQLGEKSNYLIRVFKRLEHAMQHNLLLDCENAPTCIDYGLHPLDAKELREGDLGVFVENDDILFQAFINSIELGNKIHGLDMMFEVRPMSEKFDALGTRVEFDCEAMDIANFKLTRELKNGMCL